MQVKISAGKVTLYESRAGLWIQICFGGRARCEQVVTDAVKPQTSAAKLAWLIMIGDWGGAQICRITPAKPVQSQPQSLSTEGGGHTACNLTLSSPL